MAKSEQLRKLHENMQLNAKSKHEDEQIANVVKSVKDELERELQVRLVVEKNIKLQEVIDGLKNKFPDVSFSSPEVEKSNMRPDGGITYLISKNGNKFPVLIGEVKNQGTNKRRQKEGLPKQSRGNAVERLGKNVIGFRAFMIGESIFPYVCFGDGCDFEDGSYILDRVLTIAMFGALNTDHTFNEGPNGIFNRGSYYFRDLDWKIDELYDILYDIAKRSIYYYFSKYGEEQFR